jgi:DNA-binding response OmpR family regulator
MELKLLLLFASRPNQKVTIDYLAETLNKMNNSVYTSQNIYVLIYRLRKKIEANTSTPTLIINLYPGYVLNADI